MNSSLSINSHNDIPIVMIHGLGGASSVDYKDLDLGDWQRVLIDLPGSGESIDIVCDFSIPGLAQHVERVLRDSGITQAVLFGHSMGGSVAMSLARLWPELAVGVILTEASLDPGGGSWSRRISSYSESEFAANGWADIVAEQREIMPSWSKTVEHTSPVAMYWEAVSLVNGTDPTCRETLYNLRCPRFYIFGDQSLPDDDFDELPRHGVEVMVIKDAGHNMVYENPTGLSQAVTHCLDRIVSER